MIPRFLAAATLPLFLALACAPVTPPEPPPPGPIVADCGAVCDHWRFLGCDAALPSPNGEPCEVVCATFERFWSLECMASVAKCDEIEACP